MCEKDHFEEDLEKYIRAGRVTRRDFGSLTAGAGLAMMLPRAANAQAVTEKDVEIKTPDGTCDAYFVHPQSGAHAAVLVWPDILGLRPAFRQMGKRLAESGYSVLTVNPFYRCEARAGRATGLGVRRGDARHRVPARAAAQRDDARQRREGVRRLARSAAASRQEPQRSARRATAWAARSRCARRHRCADRVGAAASFHGGGLVSQNPDSPHLLVPQMKAQYLFAVAENDDMREPEAKNVLRDTFAKAKLRRRDRGVPGRARLVPARFAGL